MEEIIYFSVNNWFCGRDYPPTENFKKWLGDDLNQTFKNDEWAKENKLCIYYGYIDMSQNYTIAAPRSWVEKNCPELLTDDEYEYAIITSQPKRNNGILVKLGIKSKFSVKEIKTTYKKKYSDFVDKPDEDGHVTSRFEWPYLEYKEENFGSQYYEEAYGDFKEDDEDDDEE